MPNYRDPEVENPFDDDYGRHGGPLDDPGVFEGEPEGDEVMWFVNEDGEPYPYPAARQREDFPNDHHLPFFTREAALAANVWGGEPVSPCGEIGCGDCSVCIPDDDGFYASYNPMTGQWDPIYP